MKKVTLHIDRLVLKGFQNKDRDAIAAGVQEELSRLLATPDTVDILAGVSAAPFLRAGPAPIRFDASPGVVGAALAERVLRRITR